MRGMHYGWAVVAAGTLSVFAALGFGRFALGMVLPSMGESLGLSYSRMGLISTGNFAGYLVAVLFAGWASGRMGARAVIVLAMAAVGVSMVLMSRLSAFGAILALYTLTGIGSGAANVPVMGLVSAWFGRGSRGRAAGYIKTGSGLAIIVAGSLVPAVNARAGAEGWRLNWLVLGMAVLAASAISYMVLRNDPSEMGLAPYGSDEGPHAPPPSHLAALGRTGMRAMFAERIIHHLGAIYFLFGITYVVYVTFLVTSLVRDRGYSEATAGWFWMWVGVLSLPSGPVFGAFSDRAGRRAGFVLVFMLQAAAYALAAAPFGKPGVYLSVFFFGISVWSIPSIMAAAVGDYLGAGRALPAFGAVTFIFALGQMAGPAAAGALADATESFRAAFAMSSALALAAAGVSALLPMPGRPGP